MDSVAALPIHGERKMLQKLRLFLFLLLLLLCFTELILGRKAKGSSKYSIVTGNRRKKDAMDEDDFMVEEVNDQDDVRPNKRKIIIPVKKESLGEKLLKTVNVLQSSVSDSSEKAFRSITNINRQIKAYFASDFESLLLQLTTPDDIQPLEKDVSTFIETTRSFLYNKDLGSPNNPYRVTLRKLWSKMVESDERTNLKAIYLLHFLFKFSEVDDALIYRKLFLKMQRETNEKSKSTTRQHYYESTWFRKKSKGSRGHKVSSNTQLSSRNTVTGLSYYSTFLPQYYKYVWKRGMLFTSTFLEIKEINYSQRIEEICLNICKGLHLLQLGILCKPLHREENELTILAMELIAHDIYELFQDLRIKINWLLQENEVGDIFASWKEQEIAAYLGYIKMIFNDSASSLKDFFQEMIEVLELYNVEFPFSMTSEAIQPFPLSQQEKEARNQFQFKEFLQKIGKKEEIKALLFE